MKKGFVYIAVLLLIASIFSLTVLVHAGHLPVPSANFAPDGGVSEVSTDFEVSIPWEFTTQALTLDHVQITLVYKKTAKLESSESAQWQSDNPAVVTVDNEGLLTAVGRGQATVTATTPDGRTAACSVTVQYMIWQWILRIFLFGWIWY